MSRRLRSQTVGSVSKHGNQAVQLQLQSFTSNSVPEETRPKNVNVVMEGGGGGVNGFNLNGFNLPEHVVETMLSYVSDQDIPNCRVVCHTWKHLLSGKYLWKLRFQKRGVDWNEIQSFITDRDSTNMWALLHSHMCHGILHKNFITNPSGHNGLEHWFIKPSEFFDNHWIVEMEPVACNPLPNSPLFGRVDRSCFATCFGKMGFMIDLWREGLTLAFAKMLLPFQIKCSQLYTTRIDQRQDGMISWDISLVSATFDVINYEHWEGTRDYAIPLPTGEWQKLEMILKFGRDAQSIHALESMRFLVFSCIGMNKSERLRRNPLIHERMEHGAFKFSHTCVTIEGLPDEQIPAGLGPIIHPKIKGRRGTLRSSYRV